MKVALIIVNFNGGALLEQCLAAVCAQTRPPDRIILVDNASEDGSAEQAQARWPVVELVALSTNQGFAAANNAAIGRCSDCDWIALLNPDAFPEPGWLSALVEAAEAYPQAGSLASCLVSATDRSRLDGAGDAYHVSGLVWRIGHGQLRHRVPQQPRQVFAACAAAALYRRGAVEAVGGFDETFFCYSEDVDLGFRLRLQGLQCWYVPDAVARHVGSAMTGEHSDFSLYHGHRNLVWTYLKDMPSGLLKRFLWQHLLLGIVSLLVLSLRYRTTAVIRGKLSALAGLRRVLRQRRIIQRERACTDDELLAVMVIPWWQAYWGRSREG